MPTRAKILSVLRTFFPTSPIDQNKDLLDLRQLSPVLGDLGADLFLELLGQLSLDGIALKECVDPDLEQQNHALFEPKLHAIKGASGTMGLSRVARQAQELRDGPTTSRDGLLGLLTLLDHSIKAAQKFVKETALPN